MSVDSEEEMATSPNEVDGAAGGLDAGGGGYATLDDVAVVETPDDGGLGSGGRDDGAPPPRGNAYWIRHGESDSNETRIYAGVVDSRLTPVGILQGKNAGTDMKHKLVDRGIKIDAVYVSYQSRALETYREALQACGGPSMLLRDPSTEPALRVDIAERNFGVLTRGNYAMLMRVLGYNRYQSILHSRDESPLGGEGMHSIYRRCRQFYETVVEPRLERGENVLVVCHSYVLMACLLYTSDAADE